MNWRKRLLLVGSLLGNGANEAPGVGVAALVKDLVGSAELHGVTCVHDHDLVGHVGDDAQVVGDHDDGVTVLLLHLLHKFDNLRLDGHIEGRSGLVGNQDVGIAGESHGDHDALAHAAGELVRILVHALLGLRDAHEVEQLSGAFERLLLGVAAVQTKALPHLTTDLVNRVERGHGVLEDHRNVIAADVLHLLLRHIEEVATAIGHGTALNLTGRHGDEAHDGHGGHGLARAGFAHHAERLAAIERVAHAVNGMHDAVLGVEVHLQVVDLEQMLALGDRLRLEVHESIVVLSHGFTRPSSSRRERHAGRRRAA